MIITERLSKWLTVAALPRPGLAVPLAGLASGLLLVLGVPTEVAAPLGELVGRLFGL